METAIPHLHSARAGLLGGARLWLDSRLRQMVGWADRAIGGRAVTRFTSLFLVYGVELAAAFWLAYELRWDFEVPAEFADQRATLIVAVVACKLLLLHSFGQFRTMLSYFSLADFSGIVLAMSAASGIMLVLWQIATAHAAPPRGVILIDFVFSVGLLSSFRLFLRVLRNWMVDGDIRSRVYHRRMAILGAGDAGAALARDLLSRRGSGMIPVFFLDDDPAKVGRSIHGLPVYGPIDRLPQLVEEARVSEVVITMPSATPKKIKQIVDMGRRLGIKTEIVPSAQQLASGEVKVDRARPVELEDLLGRAPVNLDGEEIARLIGGRTVLVTGAGGSIGSELCRQILAQNPARLILVEQAEIALFEIERELVDRGAAARIAPLIADITDEGSVREILLAHRPEILFHAAAHKHVPLMERQPAEAIKNNTLGTALLARLASELGIGKFVFISTDKAINPTSVMGCSKRLAEKALIARQHSPGNSTAFLAVRFGNVLGSSGSVIPIFKKQIAAGGPVTVTHPEMTRYFMTIPEAVGLVLQAATQGQGGEIFILDMGEPVKILEVARQMIELSGFKPERDIEIKFTGLRPGEKLFEELRHSEETHEPTRHPRVYQLRNPTGANANASEAWLAELRVLAEHGDAREVKRAMKRLVPEYVPFDGATGPVGH
jgi:FlaA1/EpsC-like NDP-sugar epimerase